MDYKKDDYSKAISFDRIIGSSTDAETVILDSDRYEIGNSKRCFPSVKKLVINENVKWIKVPNSMFPNVRTIISKSTQFRSGNVLIHESFWSRPTLLNVFGVEPDETIDLIGVQAIDSLALRGCKTIHFINTESVRFIEANSVRLSIFEDSEVERMILEKKYHEGVIMAGTILLAVNPDADEIEVPRNTTYIFPTVDFTKNKRVIIHDFRLVQTFKFEFQTLVIFDDDKSGNFSRDETYEIIAKKHATYYGIAMSVKRICEAIVRDEKSIMPISSMMHGEYGIEDVALSMPAIVGKNGAQGKVPISLNYDEITKLQESAKALKKVIEDNKPFE